MIGHIAFTEDGPVVYPDSDGEPMADNTLQFQWIVVIKENLDARLADFVGGNLLWYPVEGHPETRRAPDVLVALGRPKGERGSYRQWDEGGVTPQVIFEIVSPRNSFSEMRRKLEFYRRYGVEEYYVYDPQDDDLSGRIRRGDLLPEIDDMNGFTSPRLGIRFVLGDRLEIYDAEGRRFETFAEIKARADAENTRADAEKARADRLEAQLRALGVEPEAS